MPTQQHQTHKRLRATVIVLVGNAILLVADHAGLILLPGGGVDHNELPMAAAARELMEETGLAASSLRFLFCHESETNLHHVYFGEADGVPAAADDAESLVFMEGVAAESSLNMSFATSSLSDFHLK